MQHTDICVMEHNSARCEPIPALKHETSFAYMKRYRWHEVCGQTYILEKMTDRNNLEQQTPIIWSKVIKCTTILYLCLDIKVHMFLRLWPILIVTKKNNKLTKHAHLNSHGNIGILEKWNLRKNRTVGQWLNQ